MSQLEPWEMEGPGSEGDPQGTNDSDASGLRRDVNQNWASASWASAAEAKEQREMDEEPKERPQMVSLHTSTRGMDRMGSLEDIHASSHSSRSSGRQARTRANRRSCSETKDDLSLWQTLKELYIQNPRVKYIIMLLLLLLLAAVITLCVSLSGGKTHQDCNSASYSPDPFILLPQSTANQKSGAFGASMDASSTYLVIGDPSPICISKTEEDCAGYTVGGAAYVYKKGSKKSQHWELHSQFILSDSISLGDQFGHSVAISEDSSTIVVGSPQDDGLGVTAGAIYIIDSPFDNNIPPIRLAPDDIGSNDEFGGSVGISVTKLPSADLDGLVKVTNIVVGAASDDDFGANSGAVYVFSKFDGIPIEGTCGGQTITVNRWVQCQKVLPDDGGTYDRFGRAVHIADRTIVVGTDWDDDMGIDAGAAYVYSLGDDGNWGLQQKLLPTNSDSTANKFGSAVATAGDVIVVGADLDDAQGVDSGAAYVYSLSRGVWNLDSKLITIDDNPVHDGYKCGASVDISSDGKTILVGCPKSGFVFAFVLQNNQVWVQQDYFRQDDFYSKETAHLGQSVAAQPGSDGVVVTGNGLNGEVFSYSKAC